MSRRQLRPWLCLLAGCLAAQANGQAAGRIVSLDYCADQYVIQLAVRDSIAGVSPDATREFSYLRRQAAGLPVVRPVAEDVVIASPDLVVRSYGGGPSMVTFLRQLGIPVLQIGYSGNLKDIRQTILDMAAGLGAGGRGIALVKQMDQRLQRIAEHGSTATGQSGGAAEALYMTPSGVTSGPGTLVHDMLNAAALDNFEQRPGWHALPLERLAYKSPQVVALAFFASITNHTNVWSAIHHPVARAQHERPQTVALNGAWTACGGWFVLDAVEALHQAVLDLQAGG